MASPESGIHSLSRTTGSPSRIQAVVCVAPHKKIRLLETIETIPKSSTGKILRRVLIEQEREKTKDDGVR